MLDGSTLSKKLIGGLLDGSLGDLVVQAESSDWSVLTWSSRAWEREHDALRDVVKLAIGLEADGLPLAGAEDPVAHVVDGSISGGGGRGELSELNDLSTTLLDARSELVLDPGSVDQGWGVLASNLRVSDVWVHRGRVVAPHSHLGDVGRP